MMMADMPTYEYRCDNGHTFEITQSMSEDALESCTVCGAPAQRILFAPAVHFKGSGFYTTDYARKGNATKTANGSDPQKSDSKDSKVRTRRAPTRRAIPARRHRRTPPRAPARRPPRSRTEQPQHRQRA